MMVAFSTGGTELDANLDPRFGRCPNFLIYDITTESFRILENSQNLNAAQGAGIQSAQNVIDSGAQALITGHCGPKAFKVLQAAGIPIYPCEEQPIRNLVQEFREGKLSQLTSPDVEGHW